MKILIFGSCVTRDAFTFDQSEQFKLIRYFARTSLATVFNSTIAEDSYTSQLSSPFQRKIVGADFSKEFKLFFINQDFDYLVIDFIDDRYDIFRFHNGAKVLLSAELRQTDFIQKNENTGRIIKGTSNEWFDEWKSGCIEFIELAKRYGVIDKIIINKVFLTDRLANGDVFKKSESINAINIFLEKQYDFISQFIPNNNIINYPKRLLRANKEHRWGLSPFHYIDELYLVTLTQLLDPLLRTRLNELITMKKRKNKFFKKESSLNLQETGKQATSNVDFNPILNKLDEIEEVFSEHSNDLALLLECNKSQTQEINKLNNQINEKDKKLAQINAELEKKKQELIIANKNIQITKEKVEKTLSFQLGYKLIHSTKSFKNFISLPKDLIALALLAKDKKVEKLSLARPIPHKAKITNWEHVDGKFKKQYNFKLISILDEISHTSFDSEFKLFQLNKTSFETQIKGSNSMGLLLESCWKGNFGAWEYAFTSPGLKHQNAQNLLRAIDTANARKFPIIFWNKEDPMHYEKFLPIASKCDVIFTTDSNKVKDYQRDIPNVKVEAMLFAANIYACNPANRFRYEAENICFAGSYYGEGHDDRKKQMDALLPTIIKFDGAIYDRMSKIGSDRYAYPKKYRKFIRPAVLFKEIVDVYKQFKIFLNVNTITDSPTMMSRRVYELLACGTPVISTPSLAIDEQFKGIVQVARNAKEANKIAKRLLENEWEWLRLSHLGYREVMLKHTYGQRAMQIARALGQDIEQKEPLVSIVVASNRPQFIDRIVKNVSEQVYSNLEIIVIAQQYSNSQLSDLEHKLKNSGKNFQAIHIVRNDSKDTLGKRLNQGISLSKGEYVAKFDDDDFYFPNYLQDMLIPFKFGDYGIVGKKEIFVYLESQNKTFVRYYGQRHLQTDFLTGATLVFSRKALDVLSFGDLNRGEDSNIIEQAKKAGIKMYVADPFNFIVYRSKQVGNHTWQVEDEFFTNKGLLIGKGLAEEITTL